MTLPTSSAKTGRQTAQNNSDNVQKKRGGRREAREAHRKCSKAKIKKSKSAKKRGRTSAAKEQQQKYLKRKFSSKPMPPVRPGFVIKCKKDDANQRYDLVVDSQLADRIYIVRNTKNDRICCMKIEPFDSSNELKQLKRDVSVMLDAVKYPIFGMKHFLPIVNKGVCHEYFNYVVMPLGNGCLADIRKVIIGGDFSPETALRLTFDTFQAINDLHGLGHIHRAISPHKFVVGIGGKGLYLVGLSLCIRASKPSKTSPRKLEHYGNNRYQCRNWHRNKKQYWRDDFESWLFMVIDFFAMKLLPWNGDMSDMEVLAQKERLFNNAYDDIFSSAPKQFEILLRVLNKMGPHEKPDYQFIACTLVTLREKIKCELKGPYDFSRRDVAHSGRKKKGTVPKERSDIEEDEREHRRRPERSARREDDETVKLGKKPAAQEEEESTKSAMNRSTQEEEEEAAKPGDIKKTHLPVPDQSSKMSNNSTKKKELHAEDESSKSSKVKVKKSPQESSVDQVLDEAEDKEQDEAEDHSTHSMKKKTAVKTNSDIQKEDDDKEDDEVKKQEQPAKPKQIQSKQEGTKSKRKFLL
ncbi:hypothetical protein QR680_016398 [Steinernema hermaphroditum]|uniref:Protein kinase domain-containing protein n=1 Tax=Steinernema hermaphroditum TaxID=289476 RepID=A0AA39HB35_9BILA|nr:hypothetical protein QR680_016398 [Steinernema hermaphroditum]